MAGLPARRIGAASMKALAAKRFLLLLCLMTVPRVSPSGRQAGPMPRRTGAVFMRVRAVIMRLSFRCLTIVILAIRIGMQAGQIKRNFGVVNMCRKAVLSLTIAMRVSPTGALVGPLARRHGVAVVTTWVVPINRHCISTAKQDILTGKRAGHGQKKLGVASMNKRPAQTRRCHLTAMLDTLIGRRVGRSPRNLGVASTDKWPARTRHCPLTAMLDILVGRVGGQLSRRLGAAHMPARHAVMLSLASVRTGSMSSTRLETCAFLHRQEI